VGDAASVNVFVNTAPIITSVDVTVSDRYVRVTVSVYDDDGDLRQVVVDWGDGIKDTVTFPLTSSATEVLEHVFDNSGYYTITICDGMNNSDSTYLSVDFGGWPGF